MARRKNKQTRKYTPKNEFRRNHSSVSQGHPNFIFGRTRSGKFKSFGLTTTPKEEHPYIPLHKNPNPDDNTPAYLQKKILTTDEKYFDEEYNPKWHFSVLDMPVIRHLIKKYKKSTNRSKKKKWHKKR